MSVIKDQNCCVTSFKKAFPNVDVAILDTVPNVYEGTVFDVNLGVSLDEVSRRPPKKPTPTGNVQAPRDEVARGTRLPRRNLNGHPVRYDKDNEDCCCPEGYDEHCDLCDWKKVQRIRLPGTEQEMVGIDIELMSNNHNIKYELYPFEQGEEFEISCLGFDPNEGKVVEGTYSDNASIDSQKLLYVRKFKCSDLTLYVGHIQDDGGELDGIAYLLTKGDKIISGFYDKSYSFQEGDCKTTCYCFGDKIVIDNRGDVSSIVVIKLHLPNCS